MALAVIDTAQGYLGYSQYQSFSFQPGIYSDVAIVSVSATGLPDGASINSTTGLITFTGAVAPGQYDIGVRVTNASGTNPTPTYFFVVIEPASGVGVVAGSADIGIDIDWDIGLGDVKVSTAIAPTTATTQQAQEGASLFTLKSGDVRALNVRIMRGGVVIDPSPTNLRLVLKEFDPEGPLVIAGGDFSATKFAKINSGATAYFRMPVSLAGAKFPTALSSYEDSEATTFPALAELTLKQDVAFADVTELIATSKTFRIDLVRELAA